MEIEKPNDRNCLEMLDNQSSRKEDMSDKTNFSNSDLLSLVHELNILKTELRDLTKGFSVESIFLKTKENCQVNEYFERLQIPKLDLNLANTQTTIESHLTCYSSDSIPSTFDAQSTIKCSIEVKVSDQLVEPAKISKEPSPRNLQISHHSTNHSPPLSLSVRRFNFSHYLHTELWGQGPSPTQGTREKIATKTMLNFLQVPLQLESFVWFGVLVCLDAFLFALTFLPLRFLLSLWLLCREGWVWIKNIFFKNIHPSSSPSSPFSPSSSSHTFTPSHFHRSHLFDLCRGLVLLAGLRVLSSLSLSRVYHAIRGQTTIKLYAASSILEVLDKLFSSFGQDAFDFLFFQVRTDPYSLSSMSLALGVCLLYISLHVTSHFLFITTLTVAINTADQALVTLLLLNNFAEMKSFVFKKFDRQQLFQLACSDVTERFQVALFLFLIMLVAVARQGIGSEGARTVLVSHLWVYVFFLVGEIGTDSMKHAFIGKFNRVEGGCTVYSEFSRVLRQDLLGWVEGGGEGQGGGGKGEGLLRWKDKEKDQREKGGGRKEGVKNDKEEGEKEKETRMEGVEGLKGRGGEGGEGKGGVDSVGSTSGDRRMVLDHSQATVRRLGFAQLTLACLFLRFLWLALSSPPSLSLLDSLRSYGVTCGEWVGSTLLSTASLLLYSILSSSSSFSSSSSSSSSVLNVFSLELSSVSFILNQWRGAWGWIGGMISISLPFILFYLCLFVLKMCLGIGLMLDSERREMKEIMREREEKEREKEKEKQKENEKENNEENGNDNRSSPPSPSPSRSSPHKSNHHHHSHSPSSSSSFSSSSSQFISPSSVSSLSSATPTSPISPTPSPTSATTPSLSLSPYPTIGTETTSSHTHSSSSSSSTSSSSSLTFSSSSSSSSLTVSPPIRMLSLSLPPSDDPSSSSSSSSSIPLPSDSSIQSSSPLPPLSPHSPSSSLPTGLSTPLSPSLQRLMAIERFSSYKGKLVG